MRAIRVVIVNGFDGGEMYAEYLRHHAVDVALFKTPPDALRDISSTVPDAIVTDIVFPDGSKGSAFIQQVRRLPITAGVPIVVLSGLVRESDRQLVREAGADLFLMKPSLPEALFGEIQNAIDASRRGQRP